MNELKPCPFCGSNKVCITTTEGVEEWHGMCIVCGYGLDNEKYDSVEKAIEAWNRRAEK